MRYRFDVGVRIGELRCHAFGLTHHNLGNELDVDVWPDDTTHSQVALTTLVTNRCSVTRGCNCRDSPVFQFSLQSAVRPTGTVW